MWEEWLHTQIIVLAREMGAGDIDYDNFFKRLPEEKQNELGGRKQHFANWIGFWKVTIDLAAISGYNGIEVIYLWGMAFAFPTNIQKEVYG